MRVAELLSGVGVEGGSECLGVFEQEADSHVMPADDIAGDRFQELLVS